MSPQSSTPWFRLYSEILSDRKIQRISNTTKQPVAMIVGVWTMILALANDSPRRGKLLISEGIPVTFDEIATACGLADEDCQIILTAFSSMNMLYLDENEVYTVTQWDSRQFTSDNSTERVRKHRERQKEGNETDNPKAEQVDGGYTKRYGNVTETPPESESDKDTDTDKESSPNGEGASSKKSKRVKDSTPIPEAVKIYQTIARRLPDKILWPEIELKVGAAPECLDRWGKVITAYIGCGWNKLNVSGMLRFYEENRIPTTEPIKNGVQNGNHKQHSGPLQRTGEGLATQPVHDIYTNEYIYPDGHREPAN